jgi:DNA polymerase III epsilon subunit-like protein
MKPYPLDDLSRYKTIVVDTETTGLNPWRGARTCGIALGLVRDNGGLVTSRATG